MNDAFIKSYSSSGWSRDRINPLEFLEKHGGRTNNITYDPKLRKGDYSIIRTQVHDGTLLFTLDMIGTAINMLIYRESFYKPRPPDRERLKDIRYIVGPMRVATVYGTVNLKIGRYPGQRERIRMPVKVEYIYGESS